MHSSGSVISFFMPAYNLIFPRLASKSRVPVDAGGHSPGPIYHLPAALDRQVVSKRMAEGKSAARVSFGKASRFDNPSRRQDVVPGPGAYG